MVGLAIGGAYLAGGLAKAAVAHAQIHALAAQADGSLSEAALKATAGDPGVLAIARQHEGAEPSAQDLADRRMARLALQTPEVSTPAPVRMAQTVVSAPQTGQVAKLFHAAVAAQPFHVAGGALDSSRDLDCLTQAVYYESRGESQTGQQAVAQVVLNRVRHPAFPKTVCGVVFQHAGGGCQFSFACDGSTSRRHEGGAWDRARKVAADALDGKVLAAIGNATHFHVAALGDIWSTGMLRVGQIGSHVFYRFGGAAGAPKMFHAEPQPSEPASPAVQASAAPGPHLITAGFTPAGAEQAAGRLISASTAVVERAAAAVESVTKPAKADPAPPKTEAAPAAKPIETASAMVSPPAL